MLFDQLRALLAMPHKLAVMQLQRLVKAQAKLLHSNALLESGLAAALREWRSLDELVEATGSTRPDYLSHVLDLGVALRSLETKDDRFRLKSRILKAATAPDGEPVACFVQEFTHYHGGLLRDLPEQIAGAPPPDYLAKYGDLVAGASRLIEPLLESYVDSLASGAPMRILEVGCGSGVYLRRYGAKNAGHHGIAIDLDETVANQARDNVKAWGLADRFEVLQADIRRPGPELDGPFDLVTSIQNVYYFDDEERRALFRDLRERLAPGGRFALVTATSSKAFLFRYYDVILNGTAGCHSFPTLDTLLTDLRGAGFAHVERARLLSGSGAVGLVARA